MFLKELTGRCGAVHELMLVTNLIRRIGPAAGRNRPRSVDLR
jgi:hypothetical protein